MLQDAVLVVTLEHTPDDIGVIPIREDPRVGNREREKIRRPEHPCSASAFAEIALRGWLCFRPEFKHSR